MAQPVTPPPSAPTPPPAPTTTATPESIQDAWLPLFAGAERLETSDGIIAIRHLPTSVLFDAAFEPLPQRSRQVSEWLAKDEKAMAAVNCGFYRADQGQLRHIGLLMANGIAWSELRARWGAVLIVRDGKAFVARRPKRLLAPASLGIQGWPTLVQNRTKIRNLDTDSPARRTAVGVDHKGRVVWVASTKGMTLDAFAARLLEKDLKLIDAVNLDGGISTGLRWRLATDAPQSGPNSLPVPCAIRLTPLF